MKRKEPNKLAFNFLVMDPKHVALHHRQPTGLHLQQLLPPLLRWHTRIVQLSPSRLHVRASKLPPCAVQRYRHFVGVHVGAHGRQRDDVWPGARDGDVQHLAGQGRVRRRRRHVASPCPLPARDGVAGGRVTDPAASLVCLDFAGRGVGAELPNVAVGCGVAAGSGTVCGRCCCHNVLQTPALKVREVNREHTILLLELLELLLRLLLLLLPLVRVQFVEEVDGVSITGSDAHNALGANKHCR